VETHVRLDVALQYSILHKNFAEPCARALTEFGLIPDGFGAINIRHEVINKENVFWCLPDQLCGGREELGLGFSMSDMETRNHTIKPVKEGHVSREVVKMHRIRVGQSIDRHAADDLAHHALHPVHQFSERRIPPGDQLGVVELNGKMGAEFAQKLCFEQMAPLKGIIDFPLP
jgi:hypothetical protein